MHVSERKPTQFARLPKWAQEEIELLERRLDTMTEERNHWQNAAGYEQADAITLAPTRRPARVRFPLGDDARIDVALQEHNGNATLELMATGGTLVIEPSVTNVIHVSTTRKITHP